MPKAQERVEAWVNEESPEHRADLAASFAAGSRLGGYRLEEQVGAGGMAVVFRARDVRLDRLVALKIMTPVMGSDDMFRQRFIRESRAAAAVEDPHIIPVYEAGEAGHVLFIAMRLVRGGDVRTLLRREGPLPPDRVASIASPVASALDAAHAVGLVHRDVKPANILLDRRPGRPDHVYLSDFGLSKSAEISLGLTAAGQFLGTPDYTAPEQIEGLPVDGRTDQYALACAVFELLTGQAPFHRSESFAAIWAHLNKPPPSLTERRAELPPAVDSVMAKALAKAQADRYETCWEFADALRDALGLGPYPLGPASDPGLSRAGSRPSDQAPGGAAVLPPPGQDTDASEVYVARSPATSWHGGQSQASIADEEPTDPGRPAGRPPGVQEDQPSGPRHEASPAGAQEKEPSRPRHQASPAEPPAGVQEKERSGPRHQASPPVRPAAIPATQDAITGQQGGNLAARAGGATSGQAAGAPPEPPGVSPRRADAPRGRPAITPRQRPDTPRPKAGPPRHRPVVTRHPAPAERRGGRGGRRRATFLVLIGVSLLVVAGVAVVLNRLLAPATGPQDVSPSDFSRRTFEAPQVHGILYSVAFSPNGEMLAAGAQTGSGGTTYLWNVSTVKRMAAFSPGGGAEAFSPDGRLLAAAGGPSNSWIYVRNVASHRTVATLRDPADSSIQEVAFSANGRTVAANDMTGTVYLWSVPGHRQPAAVHPPGAVAANAVAFSPTGATLAMGGSDGLVYLVNAPQGQSVGGLSGSGSSEITSVAFSADGKHVAASGLNGVTYVWNVNGGTPSRMADPASSGVESIAFSPSGKWLATGDSNGMTYLWNLRARKKLSATLANPRNPVGTPLFGQSRTAVFSVAFSPNGKTLATTDTNGRIYLWKVG